MSLVQVDDVVWKVTEVSPLVPRPFWTDEAEGLRLYNGDALALLRRPALLPLQRRHHLPERADGQRQQGRLGQSACKRIPKYLRPAVSSRLILALGRVMIDQNRLETERHER